jgi:uncharacterized DUF497 family protein
MLFEWDQSKNAQNRYKHQIDFETAKLVFEDPAHITDESTSASNEQRWLSIGSIEGAIVLAVVHTYRGEPPEERVRIISARRASRRERRLYEQAIRERT